MFCRRLTLILLFLGICSTAFPAIFVVTSNADSGPGTLRDALTQAAANGTAEKDYINFNLADTSEAGRMITLQSLLPAITSNMVIDGTTQTGGAISPGDARIIITVNRYAYIDNIYDGAFTMLNVQNVEIYGMLFSGFNELRSPYYSLSGNAAAIYIAASQNIIIGAVGRGNVFQDNNYEIIAGPSFIANGSVISNVLIQANYFGFNDPDQSYVPSGVTVTGNNITVGGDNLNEGNHFDDALTLSGDTIKVSHNHIGIDLTGNFKGGTFQDIICNNSSIVEVSYNTSFILRLSLVNVKNFNVFANIDINTNSSLTTGGIPGVGMENCSDGVIGSDDEKLKNIFRTNTGETGDPITVTFENGSSKNIQILKNEIICSRDAYDISLQPTDHITIPSITVLVNNATEYSGVASPNSKIYVYQDTTDCPVCSPVKFDTLLTADANGSWRMTGDLTGKKWVSNALLSQNSSEFTQPLFSYLDNYYNIIQPSCGGNNGSISITSNFKNIMNFEWYNSNNEKIGVGSILNNVGPGTYYVKGFNGLCFARSVDLILHDVSPSINSSNIAIKNPSCGVGGAITGLLLYLTSNDPVSFKWTDGNGATVGNSVDVSGLQIGKYLFTLTDTVTKCNTTYGPVALQNTTGPNIDQSNQSVISTNCGQSTGSITGLMVTGTGSLKYTWTNSQQQTVGTAKDLLGQPGGTYQLQVSDESQCLAYSSYIIIPEINGITMDETKAKTTLAMCGSNNGSVTGIQVIGATQYQWADASGKTMANTIDLQNTAPGSYVLTASNSSGCSATSQTYTVAAAPVTQYPVYASVIIPSCAAKSNGSISVTTGNAVSSARWLNSQGQTMSDNSATITGLPAGDYRLYLTDTVGCETLYQTYTVKQIPQLQIVPGSALVTNDQCSLKTGNIENVQATGGIAPYTYSWTNTGGEVLSSSANIYDQTTGSYTLTVNDASGCGTVSQTFAITDQANAVAAPSVSNLQLCGAGNAILAVNDPSPAFRYQLYNAATGGTALDSETSGIFKINITNNTSLYVSQLSGTCESPRVQVLVTVGISSFEVANTFTPNGDGINDHWNIPGINNYPNALVQIFTRYGEKIFGSKGYSSPFDGTFNGRKLPGGVYYYIINLGNNCNLLSGSLTIIR